MSKSAQVIRRVSAFVLSAALVLPIAFFKQAQPVEAASQTWVSGTEDQYPSPKLYGAYWYDAIKEDKQAHWSKTRVVEDRVLPARSFFIPSDSLDEALQPLTSWREQKNWQSLNGNWKFKLVKKPAEVITNFHERNFDASAWGEMPVPANWQFHENGIDDQPMYSNWYYPWGQKSWTIFGTPNVPGETVNYSWAPLMTAPSNYNPVGHYIRDFEIPNEQRGKDVILNFQGVQSAFYVYVNGKYVGYSEDSFAQHEFDITKFVKEDQPNRLAVLVYRWSDGSLLENQDLVNYSGIIRDVGLIYRHRGQHLLDFTTKTTVSADYAQASLNCALKLADPNKANVSLDLYTADKQLVKSVKGGADLTLSIANPHLWSVEDPYLYYLVLTLYDENDQAIEYVGYQIGLREISLLHVANNKTTYAINGKPIVFKGVNRHELYNNQGHVTNFETLKHDLNLMKQHNINAIRTCHYPNAVDLYMLCNEYGLMICDEANLETHAAGGSNGIPMKVETFRYPALQRGKDMYERDKNFSSVVTWSNGNECIFFMPPSANDDGYSFRIMYKYIKERDPQRPIVLERDPRKGISDIRSRMYWAAADREDPIGKFEGVPGNDKLILEDADERPYFQVEYAHSMGNSLGYYKEYWDLWRQYPHAMGGFIWDWVDQSPLWPIPKGQAVNGMSFLADGKKVASNGTHYYAYGGDWAMDKNNNFNNFMDNGLIASNRVMHDSQQQLKYVQQSVLFSNFNKEQNTIDIKNEFSFTNLNQYTFSLQISKDGKKVKEAIDFPVDLAPLSSATINLPDYSDLIDKAALEHNQAQYLITFEVKLKNAVGTWGQAGDVIAYDQFPLNSVNKQSFAVPFAAKFHNQVTQDDNKVVVSSERFRFELDKKLGQWTQFAINGKDLFANQNDPDYGTVYKTTDNRDMVPGMYANFWRPPVDNDRENSWLSRVKYWREANFWRRWVTVEVVENNPSLTTVQVTSKFTNGSDLTEIYTIHADGQIQYTQTLDPTRGSEIPSIGAMFEMKGEFNELTYFGRGPATSYVDRYYGYPAAIYNEKVDVNALGEYVKPQDNANHVDVYWAQLLNQHGQGIFVKNSLQVEPEQRFSRDNVLTSKAQLEVMATPYNQYDVTDHLHPYELTTTNRTYFRVAFRNQGVGGLNSWGARPVEAAEIKPERQTNSFDIFPIDLSETATFNNANNANNGVNASALNNEAAASEASLLGIRSANGLDTAPLYPQADPSKLYRTVRKDSELVKEVQIKHHANDTFTTFTDFQESTYNYLIPYQDEQDPKTADVNMELLQPDYFVVQYEKLPDQGVVRAKIYPKDAAPAPAAGLAAAAEAAEEKAAEKLADAEENAAEKAAKVEEKAALTDSATQAAAATPKAAANEANAFATRTSNVAPIVTYEFKFEAAPANLTPDVDIQPVDPDGDANKQPDDNLHPNDKPEFKDDLIKEVVLTDNAGQTHDLKADGTFKIEQLYYQLAGKAIAIKLNPATENFDAYQIEESEVKEVDVSGKKYQRHVIKIVANVNGQPIELATYTFDLGAEAAPDPDVVVPPEVNPTDDNDKQKPPENGKDPDNGNKPDTGKPDPDKPDTGKPDEGDKPKPPENGKDPDNGNKPDTGKPDTGKPDSGKPDSEKPVDKQPAQPEKPNQPGTIDQAVKPPVIEKDKPNNELEFVPGSISLEPKYQAQEIYKNRLIVPKTGEKATSTSPISLMITSALLLVAAVLLLLKRYNYLAKRTNSEPKN